MTLPLQPVFHALTFHEDHVDLVLEYRDLKQNALLAYKELTDAHDVFVARSEGFQSAMADVNAIITKLQEAGAIPPTVELVAQPISDAPPEETAATPLEETTPPEDEKVPTGKKSPKRCRKSAKQLVHENLRLFFLPRQKHGMPKEPFTTDHLLAWLENIAESEKWREKHNIFLDLSDDKVRGSWATWFREVLDRTYRSTPIPRKAACYKPFAGLKDSVLQTEELTGYSYRNACRFTWHRYTQAPTAP